MSHPPRTSLTSRSSTRSQPSSAEHDSTEQLRASLTRRSRNRRAAILARRRASGQNRSGNGTRGTTLSTHEHQPNSDPDNSVISNSIGSFDNIDVYSDVNVVQQHFHRMRHRPRRLTTNDEMENDHDPSQSHHEDEQQRMGVQFFNSPSIIFPQTPYELQYPALTHEGNFTCGHCRSILWKEERSNRYS